MKRVAITLATLLMTSLAMSQTDKLDTMVSDAMKDRHIPGLAYAVVRDGKPIKVKALGLASLDYDVPVKTDTPFLLASITKTFTATSIMMLVEQGKLKLDDLLSAVLSDTPEAWKPITIRMLLTHTAGLKDRFEEAPWDASKWKANYTTEAMYRAARDTPLDFKPGEHFQYSDQGYFLLGMVVEKVSGESYGGFLKKHILDPLDMKNSSTIRLPLVVKGLATGYTQSNGVMYHNHRRSDFGMVSHFGMISTVEDLAKWDAALYGEKLLKQTTLDQMWTPAKTQLGAETYISSMGSYGFGWFINEFNGHRSVGHAGATGTAVLRYPEDKLTVIVLTNLEQLAGGDAPGIAKAIAQTYIHDLTWKAFKPTTDPKPTNGTLLKSALDGFGTGKADESIYEPAFYNTLKPQIARQKAGLAPLGLVQSVAYLGRHSLGIGEVLYYKVDYKDVALYATMQLDGQGRIQFLTVEQDLTED